MGKSKTKRKKRRRRGRDASGRKGGGVMRGMRSGFKGIASSVTGQETSGKYKWIGTAITVLLVVAALALLARRF